MATARQLARLVSVAGTISSGAVRTYLGRTNTTREGLVVVPKLVRLVSESIGGWSGADEAAAGRVAGFLCRLILRYGTMRRALEALALGRRRHEEISQEKANAWHQALSVSMGSIEPTLRRYEWLRIGLTKWMSEHGLGLEKELAAFEAWLDGPLPGSDDEHEFPMLAEAGVRRDPTSAAPAPEPGAPPEPGPDVAADVEGVGQAPAGVRSVGTENEDVRLVRSMLWSLKRPAGTFGEPVLDEAERSAIGRLRASDEALSRCAAALADRDAAMARSCLRVLEGEGESLGLSSLRGEVLYLEEKYDESVVPLRAALAVAPGGQEQATCMGNLAMALLRGQRGSMVDRGREARSLLARAVELRDARSRAWAIAQMQRGLAEMCPPQVDRDESIRAAISCLESAGAALDRGRGPGWWAESMYWLGHAWMELATGDRRANIERAIARFNDALSAVGRAETPERWVATQVEMAIAWERMPSRNREEALEHSIGCLMSALSVRRKERDPAGWARIQNNLGNLWVQFPGGNLRQNVERAIAHQRAALEVWSDQGRRVEWATTLNNLGSALLLLPTGGRGSNVKEAIAAYRQALEVRTRDRFPLDWAKTQANLANALVKDPTGSKGDNLAEAVSYYQAALEVYTRERFPRQHEVISQRLHETQAERRRTHHPT